jgi:hypothetical protein
VLIAIAAVICGRVGSGKLRAFVATALMLVSLPATAEVRIIQSALPKPFPSIGDAVVGCHDPANTAKWVEIITGKLWERNVPGRRSPNSHAIAWRRRDRSPTKRSNPPPSRPAEGRVGGPAGDHADRVDSLARPGAASVMISL